MPKSEEILSGLHYISNNYILFAIIWHVLFLILFVALLSRWVPSIKLIGTLFCFPMISVAVFAWLSGNPFNGFTFSLAAILILVFALKGSYDPITTSKLPFLVIGIIMIVFGLIYPHFIEANSIFKYLYASPSGLIPCPTLSILIGILLLFNGLNSHPISIIFIILGLFYGLFGVLKLTVFLDLFLLSGTLILLLKYILALVK